MPTTLILFLGAVMSFHAAAYDGALPAPEDIAAKWDASLATLHSVHIVWRQSSTEMPYDKAAFRDPSSAHLPPPSEMVSEIWWQDGKRREQHPGEDGAKRTWLYDGEKALEFVTRGEEHTAHISSDGATPTPPPVPLTEWLARLRGYLNAEGRSVTVARDETGRAVMHFHKGEELETTLVLAPELNWAIVEEVRYRQREDFEGTEWAELPEVQPGQVRLREVYQDFQEVAPGVHVALTAFVATRTPWKPDELRLSHTHCGITVNQPFDTRIFSLVLPQGTRVTDDTVIGSGRRYTVGPFGMKLTQGTVADTLEEKAINVVAGWLD